MATSANVRAISASHWFRQLSRLKRKLVLAALHTVRRTEPESWPLLAELCAQLEIEHEACCERELYGRITPVPTSSPD